MKLDWSLWDWRIYNYREISAERQRKYRLLDKMHPTIAPANCNECELHRARMWVIIVYNRPAIRTTLEGSTLPSMKGCAVCQRTWLAQEEAKPSRTFMVLFLLHHVFLRIAALSPLLSPQYLFISSLAAHRAILKRGEERQAVAPGRRRVRKSLRWDEQQYGHGALDF